jgi:hypothetical protein
VKINSSNGLVLMQVSVQTHDDPFDTHRVLLANLAVWLLLRRICLALWKIWSCERVFGVS